MDYVMDGPSETERLEGKTSAEDVRSQLEAVGLSPGMTVLDAGCGSGAVARVMAELVGPAGAVIGVDASRSRLRDGVVLARSSASAPRFCAGALDRLPIRSCVDLVWSRFVLEYQATPELTLAELLRVVRPGGKLVVGDVDDHGLHHHPEPPVVADGLERVRRALVGRFNPRMGRELYHLVKALVVSRVSSSVYRSR